MKWVAHSLQGRRDENEDYHVVPTRKQHAKGEVWPLAVFDGHGGNRVSSYLKRSLVPGLLANPKKCFHARYLKDCFRRTSVELGKKHPKVATDMGSTAAVVLVRKDGMVVCCNVGDSRAVLCRGGLALPLSVDHKPNAPDERARIEQAGGKIKRDGSDYRIQGLAVSRAFGDLDTSPYVTPRPGRPQDQAHARGHPDHRGLRRALGRDEQPGRRRPRAERVRSVGRLSPRPKGLRQGQHRQHYSGGGVRPANTENKKQNRSSLEGVKRQMFDTMVCYIFSRNLVTVEVTVERKRL